MAKCYLILRASSRASGLARRILLAFAGGYGPGDTLVPVLVTTGADQTASLFRDYRKIADNLGSYGICQVSVDAPVLLAPGHTMPVLDDVEELFAQWCKSLPQALLYREGLLSGFKPEKNARVVVAVGDRDETDGEALLLAAASVCADCRFGIVYENTRVKPDNAELVERLRFMQSLCAEGMFSVTGLREDFSELGFTRMQTSIAVIDMLAGFGSGVPVIPAVASSVNFSMMHLQTPRAVDALRRVAAVSALTAAASAEALARWRKQLRVNDIDLLKHNIEGRVLSRLQSMYDEWMLHQPDIEFDANWIDSSVYDTLNSHKQISSATSADERHAAALKSIFDAAPPVADDNQAHYSPLSLPDENDRIHGDGESLSPTTVLEYFDSAFGDTSDRASMLRSAVLDIWEAFYANSDFTVVLRCDFKNLRPLLMLSEAGREFVEMDYALVGLGECVSSPLTGFVPTEKVRARVGVELAQRSEHFRRFMRCYINLQRTAFSPRFRAYVESSTGTSLRKGDNDAFALFRNFPSLARDIGLDYR